MGAAGLDETLTGAAEVLELLTSAAGEVPMAVTVTTCMD